MIKSLLRFLNDIWDLFDAGFEGLFGELFYDGLQPYWFYNLPEEDKSKIYKAVEESKIKRISEFELKLSDGKVHKFYITL